MEGRQVRKKADISGMRGWEIGQLMANTPTSSFRVNDIHWSTKLR